MSDNGAYDVLITGAKVIDGSGNPWFYGDVAISGDRIAAVEPKGRLKPGSSTEVVDGTGMVACPGFIDIQSHSIIPFFSDTRSISKVTQGVTTEIMGEGWTPAPFGGKIESPLGGYAAVQPEMVERMKTWTRFRDWIDYLTEAGVSVNYGSFLGGATVREYAKGWALGDPTDDELQTMKRVTAEAMEDGAFGVATALIYPPGSFATDPELVEVARVVGEHGGVYITHMRSEADFFLESLETTIQLAREANVPVELYHLKVAGRDNWPKMRKAIERVDQARAEGLDITSDMYPYIAGGTGLAASLPPWASADGKLLDNLRDPVMRERIRAELLDPSGDWEPLAQLCTPEGVLVVGTSKTENEQYRGKFLSEIAEMRGQHWADALMDLVLSEERWTGTMYFFAEEENIRLQVQQPWIKFSTDAPGIDPDSPNHMLAHPRTYGTYTRVLGRYVREEGLLTLEDAIRKMTSSVADRLSLRDRGLLREGMYADVVLFDPEIVIDRATYTDGDQVSEGIRDVWVNGGRVLKDGAHTGAKPGLPVYGPGRI
jgi:N-acyl-D-amino-acid deacylase